MLKRGLSVFLATALMMLCFFCVPAFAAEPEFDIRDYTFEDLQDMTTDEKKELMAKFIETYNPYGLRDMMEAEAQAKAETRAESLQSGSTVQPMWKSDSDKDADGQQMATHQLITLEALGVFINDYGFYSIDGTTAFGVVLYLAAASGLPDLDEHDHHTFAGHFYNPNTGKNWLQQTSPTAKTRVGEHYANASLKLHTNVNMIVTGSDFLYVLEELGRALHYIQDVCEPHHASNQIGGITSHAEFESFVETNIDTLLPSYESINKDFYAQANNMTAQNLTHLAAQEGYKYADYVGRLRPVTIWMSAASLSLGNAIIHSARLIYKIFADNGAWFIYD